MGISPASQQPGKGHVDHTKQTTDAKGAVKPGAQKGVTKAKTSPGEANPPVLTKVQTTKEKVVTQGKPAATAGATKPRDFEMITAKTEPGVTGATNSLFGKVVQGRPADQQLVDRQTMMKKVQNPEENSVRVDQLSAVLAENQKAKELAASILADPNIANIMAVLTRNRPDLVDLYIAIHTSPSELTCLNYDGGSYHGTSYDKVSVQGAKSGIYMHETKIYCDKSKNDSGLQAFAKENNREIVELDEKDMELLIQMLVTIVTKRESAQTKKTEDRSTGTTHTQVGQKTQEKAERQVTSQGTATATNTATMQGKGERVAEKLGETTEKKKKEEMKKIGEEWIEKEQVMKRKEERSEDIKKQTK